MRRSNRQEDRLFKDLRWQIRLTHAGLLLENTLRAFWPFLSVAALLLSAAMLGLGAFLPADQTWRTAVLGAAGVALLILLVLGALRFRYPARQAAVDRVDTTVPGRPIATLTDALSMGDGDFVTRSLWYVHRLRLREDLKRARPVAPDPRLRTADPFGIRLAAVLAVVVALFFGSFERVAEVGAAPAGDGTPLAAGPSWEGWAEPPGYTGKPSLYLADLTGDQPVELPVGTRITIRLYGDPGELAVAQTVAVGMTDEASPDPAQSFALEQSGFVRIQGSLSREWQFSVLGDSPPDIQPRDGFEARVSGAWRQPFEARDDYGVRSGWASLALDLPRVDRRHGLAAEPEPRAPIEIDLPLPFTGDRRDIDGVLEEMLVQHPWAGLPVTLEFGATDAARQVGLSDPNEMILPARRFYDPLAASLIEQRRDLLWTRENAGRAAAILRAVSNLPEDVFDRETDYLRLRGIVRRLESLNRFNRLSPEALDEIAEELWDMAVGIEEGNLSDALERLRNAQDRLQQAMRDGASDEEIAELMEELRQAMQDYLRQLAEQAPESQQQEGQQQGEQMTGDMLDEMLNRLQELMEQGRMAEAQQLLEQLRQMLENMQVTQGQQGQQGPGQQALEDLADTLRQQQELSDDTFGDLQEQFGDGQQGEPGEQGQGGQDGRQPGEGQQRGNGRDGVEGEGGQGEMRPGQGNGGRMSLADRQQALRDMLDNQRNALPGGGSERGEAARRSLDEAGRSMGEAEDNLRSGELADALENQSDAMDALRDGMRELAEQMAEQRQDGQQGQATAQGGNPQSRDPLGREPGNGGLVGTDQEMLRGGDVYRRAEELLNELRRRSAERERPTEELDYIERLLEQF